MANILRRLSFIVSLLFILLFASVLPVVAAQPIGQLHLGFANGDDWEPAIAADRYGHVYVIWPHYFSGVSDIPGCPDCPSPTAMIQISSDRGLTWSEPRVVTPGHTGTYQVDVQIVVDPVDGETVYASWLQNNKSDTVVTKSIDFGKTWSEPVVADSTNAGTDKPILVVRGHDVYVGFDHMQKMYVAVSHDGGTTFTSYPVRQNSEYDLSLAGGGVVDSHGNVYYSWAGYTRSGNAKGPVYVYISKSSDGGRTWTADLLDTSGAPPDCSAYKCGWAYLGAQITLGVDSNDTLYALWNAGTVDKGPERIYFARSVDQGMTWSPRQDVSQAGSGVSHAFPAITAGAAGDVRLSWMDARNAPMWNVYYRPSQDGGETWSVESQLSSYVPGFPYISPTGFAFPYGDYFELDVDDRGDTHAVWGEGPNWIGPGTIWYTRLAR